MTKTFTQDDVVRYIYAETTPEENVLLEGAMVFDDELLGFYLDCLEICQQMDKIVKVPSDKAVSSILLHSASYFSNQSARIPV